MKNIISVLLIVFSSFIIQAQTPNLPDSLHKNNKTDSIDFRSNPKPIKDSKRSPEDSLKWKVRDSLWIDDKNPKRIPGQ